MTTELTTKRNFIKNLFGNRFDFTTKEKNGVVQGTWIEVDYTGYKVPRKFKDVSELLVVAIKLNTFIAMSGSMDIIELPLDIVKK